jgi:hypothetical protein
MEKRLCLHGNNTGPITDLAAAAAAIPNYRLVPVIDVTFSMEPPASAYEHVATRVHLGNVAIQVH